jgi:hypothetical protein
MNDNDIVDLSLKPVTMSDVRDFIHSIYELRFENDVKAFELPFNICDYYYMEQLLEFLDGVKP